MRTWSTMTAERVHRPPNTAHRALCVAVTVPSVLTGVTGTQASARSLRATEAPGPHPAAAQLLRGARRGETESHGCACIRRGNAGEFSETGPSCLCRMWLVSQLQTQAGLGRTLAGDSVPRVASHSQNLPRMHPPVVPACAPRNRGSLSRRSCTRQATPTKATQLSPGRRRGQLSLALIYRNTNRDITGTGTEEADRGTEALGHLPEWTPVAQGDLQSERGFLISILGGAELKHNRDNQVGPAMDTTSGIHSQSAWPGLLSCPGSPRASPRGTQHAEGIRASAPHEGTSAAPCRLWA